MATATAVTRPAKPEVKPDIAAFRGVRATVDAAKVGVDREGGRFGAGLISAVSMISVGEALGHRMWIDAETLSQVQALAQANEESGIKARFTHPGLSSDGMGRLLGRLHDPRVENGRVLADLHLAKTAHDTPDGDLAEYAMSLAEEDPKAAGLSIVFRHDFAAEEEFTEDHQEEFEYEDHRGRKVKEKRFRSPDPENVNNYPHVRLSELRACDLVDEPAANPAGYFDRQDLAREADAFLSYIAGMSDDVPQESTFGVDPERARSFLGKWLNQHKLSITESGTETEMDDETNTSTETPAVEQPTRETFAAELNKFTERFGAENGVQWFSEGKSYSECLELHSEQLQTRLNEAEQALADAEAKFESLELGETEPVQTGASDGSTKKTFAEAVKSKKS